MSNRTGLLEINPVILFNNRGGNHKYYQQRKSQVYKWGDIEIRYDRQFIFSVEVPSHYRRNCICPAGYLMTQSPIQYDRQDYWQNFQVLSFRPG